MHWNNEDTWLLDLAILKQQTIGDPSIVHLCFTGAADGDQQDIYGR